MYTVDHTFSCLKSSAHAHGIEIRGDRTQTSDGDPRTGTFPQMQPTAGDAACSMNGV